MKSVAQFEDTLPKTWSQAQLALEFQLDRRTVKRRLSEHRVQPAGKTARGYPGFLLVDAAPALLEVTNEPDPLDLDPDKFPPRDRKDWYEAEKKKRELEVLDGELIPAVEVEEEMAGIYRTVANWCDTLTDVMERDAGLSPEQGEKLQASVDKLRDQLHMGLIE